MFKIYVELKNVVDGKDYKVSIKKDDGGYEKEASVSASKPSTTFENVPAGGYSARATDEHWAAHTATFNAFQDGQTVQIFM